MFRMGKEIFANKKEAAPLWSSGVDAPAMHAYAHFAALSIYKETLSQSEILTISKLQRAYAGSWNF